MSFTKIVDGDLTNKGVRGLPDTPNLGTTDMQNKFEEVSVDVIIPKHNGLIDELEADTAAASIGAVDSNGDPTTVQAQLVSIQSGGYTKDEADAKFLTQLAAADTYLTQAHAADTYVAQVTGKDLSTNDYTDADKTKLAGIEAGANNYTLPIANINTLGGVKPDGTSFTVDSQGIAHAVGSGGTSDYTALNNKPKINGVELYGDKPTSSFGFEGDDIAYDNTTSGLTATNVQSAIDELAESAGGSNITVNASETALYGQTVTLSDGTTTLTTTFSNSGVATFTGVTMTGSLTIASSGVSMSVSVPYYGNYTFIFSLFSATVTVTFPYTQGATCNLSDGTTTLVATGSPMSFNVPNTGTWTATVTLDGASKTDSAVITTDGQTASITIEYGTINLTYANEFRGQSVTCTDGNTTITKIAPSSGNTMYFYPPTTGSWTISVTYSGDTFTAEASVSSLSTPVNVPLDYVKIYGISRTVSTSDSEWTRTDDAVGATFSASIGSTAGSSSFDNFYPWSEMERVTENSDVFVKIPKFWFKRYVDSGVEYIKIADHAHTGFTLHPAFLRDGVTYDYILVGAYHTASGYVSQTNKAPLVSITRATARSGSAGRGTGYSQWDVATWDAIKMLILVEIADWNVQSKIGRGYCDGNSSAINSGSCDSVANLTGRPSGTDGKTGVVWRGIENLWGNIWQWVDGCNWNGGTYYVCNKPSAFADDTATGYTQLSYTGATSWSQSYITEIGVDDNNPAYMLPKSAGSGNDTTYICDATWSATGWQVLGVGGRWNSAGAVGVGTADLSNGSSATYTSLGSRLLKLPS